MFEDKRFKNDNDNNSNSFLMPDNNTGLRDGNDNLNFGEQPQVRRQIKQRKERKINKKFFLFLLIIVLGLFIGGGYLVFNNIFNNPYRIYKTSINYGFDYVNTKLNDFNSKKLDYDLSKDILATSGSFSIDSNLLESFKGFDFKYKLTMDLNKEMIDSNLVINKDNKKVLDIEGFLRDKKILINSKDLYNKYLEIKNVDNLDLSFNDLNFNNNILNDILNSIKSSVISNLDKNKMTTDNIKIKVQNKNINVINNIYKLNNEDVKKIYQNVIDSLINDNNIIENLADTFNLRKAEIKEILENLKVNENILNSFKTIEFNLYTTGITNKVIGGRVLYNNIELINYTNFKDVLNVNTSSDSNKVDILKDSKETKLNFIADDSNLLSIIITKKDDKTNFSFDLEIEKLEVEGNLEVEIKRVANKKITTNVILDVKGKNDKDNFNINIEFSNVIQVGGTIQNIPKNNIVIYDNLSESDKKDIENKFNNIYSKLPFKDLFNNGEEQNICDIITDCECLGSICTCSYLDKNGVEQNVNCLNKAQE